MSAIGITAEANELLSDSSTYAKWCISQPLGDQDINYAELYAIGQGLKFLNFKHIPYKQKRIIIQTDSESAFNNCFHLPGHRSTCKDLHYKVIGEIQNKTQRHDCKIIFIKVRSHLDRYGKATFRLNDDADKLAEKGRKFGLRKIAETHKNDPNFNFILKTPNLGSFALAKITSCYLSREKRTI